MKEHAEETANKFLKLFEIARNTKDENGVSDLDKIIKEIKEQDDEQFRTLRKG